MRVAHGPFAFAFQLSPFEYHFLPMHDEPTPRNLRERTGKHRCVKCLADVPMEEYLRNDHICDACAAEGDEYPLATTPDAKKSEE